jgi:DNA-binding beta-propeller fold protein YncE
VCNTVEASSNNVSAYSIGANRALTPVPGSPPVAGGERSSVAVDPTGNSAYVANLGGTVSAYTIDPSAGALKAIAGSLLGRVMDTITRQLGAVASTLRARNFEQNTLPLELVLERWPSHDSR